MTKAKTRIALIGVGVLALAGGSTALASKSKGSSPTTGTLAAHRGGHGPSDELDAAYRDEVAKTVRRVVDKLLHAPTVRVKQLASAPGGDSYAEALRELFELDQQAVDAVAAGELPLVSTDLDKTE